MDETREERIALVAQVKAGLTTDTNPVPAIDVALDIPELVPERPRLSEVVCVVVGLVAFLTGVVFLVGYVKGWL